MNYYKNKKNEIYAFESDGSQDHLIKPEFVKMTASEVDAHLNPPKTQEQLYLEAKEAKLEAVEKITVKTASGKVFDGNEVAQNRMSRAVTASAAGETTEWIMADNTKDIVIHEELKEALRLAGDAMTAIWVS